MTDRKSVVIVGNGGSLKNYSLGAKIDEFDEVVRINNWHTLGFEDLAGTKTTVWITFRPNYGMEKFTRDLLGKGNDLDEIRNAVKDVREIWYVTDEVKNHINVFWQEWHTSRKNVNLRRLRITDRIIRKLSHTYCHQICQEVKNPSTGLIGIWLLTQLYSKVYIAGFDSWCHGDESDTRWYFDNTHIEKQEEYKLHFGAQEASYIKKLIDLGDIEILTADTAIEKAYVIGDTTPYVCSTCGKTSNLYQWQDVSCNYCDNK